MPQVMQKVAAIFLMYEAHRPEPLTSNPLAPFLAELVQVQGMEEGAPGVVGSWNVMAVDLVSVSPSFSFSLLFSSPYLHIAPFRLISSSCPLQTSSLLLLPFPPLPLTPPLLLLPLAPPSLLLPSPPLTYSYSSFPPAPSPADPRGGLHCGPSPLCPREH